jgi:hypothetical protein
LFTLKYVKSHFYQHIAYEAFGDALCMPELLTAHIEPGLGGWRPIAGLIDTCEPWQLYNLLEFIHRYIPKMNSGILQYGFVNELNTVLAEESIGWRMDFQGQLQRQLPKVASTELESLFRELQAERFSPALTHVEAARDAYSSRPRSGRNVCSEIFDALESVAKEVFSMPTATFGDVVKTMRSRSTFSRETLSTLEKIYALASNHFRHGMTDPFALSDGEVEFVYLTCIGGMLMLVRHASPIL